MNFLKIFHSIKNSSVNKIIVSFGFSNLFILLANLVSGIFIMKFINPYEFGIYNKFLIITNYIILLNFGIPVVLQSKSKSS